MIDHNNDAVKQFLFGLVKLTKETGVAISGCGCCGSPYLIDVRGSDDNCYSFNEGCNWIDYGKSQFDDYCVTESNIFETNEENKDDREI